MRTLKKRNGAMGEGEDRVASTCATTLVQQHQELFHYLTQMLAQIEEQTGEPDLELRQKISSLKTETMRPPTTSLHLNELEIDRELNMLSVKLDSVEQSLSQSVLDPQVQRILSGTAGLWMPTITASSQERISIAANSEAPNMSQDVAMETEKKQL